MCNERGGVIDDLYAYRLAAQEYLLIINASRIEADVAWLEAAVGRVPPAQRGELQKLPTRRRAGGARPARGGIHRPLFPGRVHRRHDRGPGDGLEEEPGCALQLRRRARSGFRAPAIRARMALRSSRRARIIEAIWNQLLSAGQPHGLKPAGLGARDTLRTEVCYPLYGHELDENTTPIEAGVGFFVALDKGEFIGRAVLAEQKAKGPARKLVAFKMTDRSAPPRPHYAIWSTGPGAAKLGRGRERHAEPVAGHWHRDGVCAAGICQGRIRRSRSKSVASAPRRSWCRSRSIENRIDRPPAP